jgi:hypothetical protein
MDGAGSLFFIEVEYSGFEPLKATGCFNLGSCFPAEGVEWNVVVYDPQDGYMLEGIFSLSSARVEHWRYGKGQDKNNANADYVSLSAHCSPPFFMIGNPGVVLDKLGFRLQVKKGGLKLMIERVEFKEKLCEYSSN